MKGHKTAFDKAVARFNGADPNDIVELDDSFFDVLAKLMMGNPHDDDAHEEVEDQLIEDGLIDTKE